ncbi:MAG: homoserine dehydrogenase [Acidobacteriota bacterium]|jgi:homoserine dehydrogenase|nr:homoserine dehydrogenase [Acidobacteriota bacterium]
MKPIRVGLLGLGTVGAGVAKVCASHREELEEKIGAPVELAAVVDKDTTTPREGLDLGSLPFSDDPAKILGDPSIDIVVELIGGVEAARELILKALEGGKHVVTANKALLATHGAELYAKARACGRMLAFEAAVAGGIPIIRAVKEGLAANRVNSLYGIVNGTSNYILTKMTDEGSEFGQVLKEAQARGYAEADPTFDVEGVDSAHKLQVLATLAFRTAVKFDDIYVEGVSKITPQDIALAREMGFRIKLLAIAKSGDGALELRVHPTMIPEDSPMAAVSGVFNAVFMNGDVVGDLMFYGRGAGQLPTASSVWADIVEIARRLASGQAAVPQDLPILGNKPLQLKPFAEVRSAYYLYVLAKDQPSVLSRITGILGANDISIASVIQKGHQRSGAVPVVIMTHVAREGDMGKALQAIQGLPVVESGSARIIRIEESE